MTHKVSQGENLYRIGLKYGCSAEDIRVLNSFKDYTIYVGQNILIPEKEVEVKTETQRGSILKPSDLCITPNPVPLNVMDSLIVFHYLPIREVMKQSGLTIWASLKSGYRPRDYEIATGRGAGSQHTFEIVNKDGTGAVDWTTDKQYLDLLEVELIRSTNYKRIARYKGFIHCDYKDIDGTRRLYRSDENSNWTFIKSF
jgi:LysM repeat protein